MYVGKKTETDREIETDSHPTAKQCLDAAGSGEKSCHKNVKRMDHIHGVNSHTKWNEENKIWNKLVDPANE